MRRSSSPSRARARVLQEALGRDREQVVFADMEEIGRNPGRIIGAWRDFIRAHADTRRPRWASASRSGPSARRRSSSSATGTRRC